MAEHPIRVGIVGAGSNTREQHIPGLRAIDGVEIVSVCNRSRESSERVAQEFGIPTVYEHWQDLVGAEDTDAIVIGTWPYLHHDATVAALTRGKHVMCEARMAMNAAQARHMLQVARSRPKQVAQVVPSPFTLSVDRTICRLLAEGYIGDVLAVEVRASNGAFLDMESPLQWRQDTDLSGMNVMSLGIWYEAVMRWIGEAARVMAMGNTFVPQRWDAQQSTLRTVRVPEHLDVIAEMACGAQAYFGMSSVAGLAPKNEATLFGSDGTLRFCGGTLSGGRRGEPGLQPIDIPPDEAVGWRVEAEFINAIRGLEPIRRTTFEDGVRYMEFTGAVHRSLQLGCAAVVPFHA